MFIFDELYWNNATIEIDCGGCTLKVNIFGDYTTNWLFYDDRHGTIYNTNGCW